MANFGDQRDLFNDLNTARIPGVTVTLKAHDDDGRERLHSRTNETPPTTLPNVPVSVTPGGTVNADFGNQQLTNPQKGNVTGTVWNDINGDGVQQPGEPGVPGVKIELRDPTQTSLFAVTYTDANGNYIFPNVTPQAYVVYENVPAGFVNTTPISVPVAVLPGGVANADFGIQKSPTPGTGNIDGTVFNDTNGDGVRQPGEPGIPGATVTLKDQNGNPVATTTTDPSGNYSFPNVPPGSYTVTETVPPGYTPTTPTTVPVSVTSGSTNNVDFGNQPAPQPGTGNLTGTVFYDINGDGVQQPLEPGIPNVSLTALGPSGLLTTTTDANGNYIFPSVAPGSYTVTETVPTGYTATTPTTKNVTVPTNGTANADFGNQLKGTVSGIVFNDVNGDGINQPTEGGIGGVIITLKDSNGNTVQTTTTAADGSYLFYGVTPGAYTVVQTLPLGFTNTTPLSVSVTVPSGGAAYANFGDKIVQSPTNVVLTSFTGMAEGHDAKLNWATATEVDVLGFRLLRSDKVDGPYSQLGDIIPATGLGGGDLYQYVDSGLPTGAWYYRIEVVSFDGGVITTGGPVSVTIATAYRVYLPLLIQRTVVERPSATD
ncbi:MAG: SdrD B-like domain-containing protein [Anaerolineae bacterium]